MSPDVAPRAPILHCPPADTPYRHDARGLAVIGALAAAVVALSPVLVNTPPGTPHHHTEEPFMAATILPTLTGPNPVGNRRLFLTDTSRPDPFSGAATRQVSVTAWYPSLTIGSPARYLSATDSSDETMALALTNGLEGAGCTKSWWNGTITCGGLFGNVNPNTTMFPNIRARDTRATVNGTPRTDLGLLPTVVFSPGFGVPGNHASIIAEELASHGYLVLTLSHTWESIATELAGSVALQNGGAVSNQWGKVLAARVADAKFVLNQLPTLPNGIGAVHDPTRIAAAGHSFGGLTGLELAYQDSRIKAVCVLDGTAGYTGTTNGAQDHGLPIPVMLLSATVNLSDGVLVGAEHPSWATYQTHPHGPLYLYQVAGTKHFAFTDVGMLTVKPADLLGTIAASRAMALHPRWARAFLDTHLRSTPDPLLTLPSTDWPEVTAV